MRENDLHWLAGLLEGEGCFMLRYQSRKDGSRRPTVSVILGMTDEDVVRRAHAIVGSGTINTWRKSNPNARTWKPQWVWQESHVDRVRALITALRPLMGQRRRAKIDQMLVAIEGWVRRPVRTHGSLTMYFSGCRCAPCKAANTKHSREWREKKRAAQSLTSVPLVEQLA